MKAIISPEHCADVRFLFFRRTFERLNYCSIFLPEGRGWHLHPIEIIIAAPSLHPDNDMKIDTDTTPKESTVSTRLQCSRIVLMADDFRCEMKIFIVIALHSLTKEYPMNLNLQWLNYANDRE